jgi:hypothetical protein
MKKIFIVLLISLVPLKLKDNVVGQFRVFILYRVIQDTISDMEKSGMFFN